MGAGWGGAAGWTALVLDFLPDKTPQSHERRSFGWLRYLACAASIVFVAALFLTQAADMERIMFRAFIFGNLIYYALGIGLAVWLRDNRAFCKYICPVTVFLKPARYFSLFGVTSDKGTCATCGQCVRLCTMDVDMTNT